MINRKALGDAFWEMEKSRVLTAFSSDFSVVCLMVENGPPAIRIYGGKFGRIPFNEVKCLD